MAQKTINIGTVANDGTGDTLRGAFANTNNNFTELYNNHANVTANIVSVAVAGNNWTNTVSVAVNTYIVHVGTMGNNFTSQVGRASNTWANTVGIAGNNYAIQVGAASNTWANTTFYTLANGSSAFNHTNASFDYANAAYLLANSAFNYANAINDGSNNTISFDHANAAFDKANSANVLAYDTGISINAYAVTIGAASNTWANTLYVSSLENANNGSNSSNAYAVTIGAASNNYANITFSSIIDPTFINNITVNKTSNLGGVVERLFSNTSSITGNINFDCSNNHIFYLNNITGPFTPNLQNLSIVSNTATSLTFIIDQGASANITSNNVLIGASNLSINWQGGSYPTRTPNKKDVVTISIFNVNGSNTILGQSTSFG